MELLVYIMSFLPTIRDKVKLRYVSRTLRVVSETPSLWSEFVWPLYNCREERSVMSVLQACGDHVKRLTIPEHVTATPTLFQMLSHCNNVIQLNLPPETKIDSEELKTALRYMEHLEKLEVQLSTDIKPLLQIGGLKELTVHVPKQYHSLCTPWVKVWMRKDCVPWNLNLVTEMFGVGEEAEFIQSILRWNFRPLTNYSSHFKLYYRFREPPLNLYPSLPEFQVEFGQTVILPFLKASSFGILGLSADIFTLTNCICDGKTLYKMESESHGVNIVFDNNSNIVLNPMDSLNCVTEFNFIYTELVHSGHLEQLAVACPNLQRLNVENNCNCLSSLQGLRVVAQHCYDLHGLSFKGISVEDIESHLGFWEILSSMKLTHLVIDVCVYYPLFEIDPSYDQQLAGLFQRCSHLEALQLESFYGSEMCEVCDKGEVNWLLLSHVPVLKYCSLAGNQSSVVQDVINNCKLTIFWCNASEFLMISSVSTTNLQQFFIDAEITNIPDIFMDTVSAHGGLIHVVLSVNSVTVQGVTILVTNSPQLLTLHVWSRELVCCKYQIDAVTSKDELKEDLHNRFPNRKLFTIGSFSFDRGFEFVRGTDMFPLWPCYRSF